MSKKHEVVQGETLSRIARMHGFSCWKTLYEHPDNEPLRKLRPNPNLLYPGDVVIIPEKKPQVVRRDTAAQHTFRLTRSSKDMFRMKIRDLQDAPLVGTRVVLVLGDRSIDTQVGADGLVEAELPSGDETSGELQIFTDPDSDQPSHVFEVQLGHLDPVDTPSGVQARCNLLGHDCGPVDGIIGEQTRAGIKSFQHAYGLEPDGIAGPTTQAKLEEVYGC